jgi:hypothetical protein
MIPLVTRRRLVRDFEAGQYLDLFMVSAVTAVLLIRFYLHLTGYPTVGGDALHVAHVLWGGLLMLASIILLVSTIGRGGRRFASVLGGVGFGTFIDEVGKFVTHDNDYFYEPAVAIMYVVFIGTYVAVRSIHRERIARSEEYIVNAIKELEEVIVEDLDEEERERALSYLRKSKRTDPAVRSLQDLLSGAPLAEPPPPDMITRVRRTLTEGYRRLTTLRGFRIALVVFFVLRLVVSVGYLTVLFRTGETRGVPVPSTILTLPHPGGGTLGFVDIAHAGAEGIAALFVALGIWRLVRSRLDALRMFQRSVLVSIFLSQVFAFYRDEWAALIGLGFNVALFVALQFAIERERVDAEERATDARRSGT